MEKSNVRSVLKNLLIDIDDSTLDYFESMVTDSDTIDREGLKESLAPFIESYGLANDLKTAEDICDLLCDQLKSLGIKEQSLAEAQADVPKLLEKSFNLSNMASSQISESEQAAIDTMWGFDSVRKKRNDVMEVTEAGSAKYERKAAKEQRKWLDDLENKFPNGEEEDDNNQISAMTLPDLSGTNREKDIQVNNFTIMYGGHILLEGADLRLVFGRRYGLIGRNGVGKTTLLKHMANFDIEGFPRHHRVLHVKQEVKSSSQSVLEVVLSADVERAALLQREKDLAEKQRLVSSEDSAAMQDIMNEMCELNERMQLIGVASSESRAASILSGLQFSEEMQRASTESLSGGWRMRVALAGALLVEPDLLMLDEPTNHLDLEAVLWLEEYLKSYPKTVLLVSHDKAFLNDVCTDIVLFVNQKLNYYRGNYDSFESTYKEMRIVQQKQHEAQQVKIQHMQEFVDKFRYNAKRASLVQSRIKSIERETVVDAVEEEVSFSFSFFDAGQLGRPIIQIEGVSFAYENNSSNSNNKDMKDSATEEEEVLPPAVVAAARSLPQQVSPPKPPLFCDVHLGVDQSSRVALVGPNGCGKSTLINLLQGKLTPQVGFIRVNPQLRVGIFTQHHMDSFDLALSPLQNMAQRWHLSNEADLRAHLGRYEITGNDALKPMKFSSGGQKSRVAFACLTFAKPHVVILDEPTNHLDMGAIEALATALRSFQGGVLVVSHDQHFITSVCNEIWVIKDRKVCVFDGAFDDYKKSVINKIRSNNNSSGGRKK